MIDTQSIASVIEALLLASEKPLSTKELHSFFDDDERPTSNAIQEAIQYLQTHHQYLGFELVEIASGYRFQIKKEWGGYVQKLWQVKPPKYSRAFMETLALVAYRQPITRGEIEEIRGVSISNSIFKTLVEEREWIKAVGHKDVPGRPAIFATTKKFLDYFNIKSLEDLPAIAEVAQAVENMDTQAGEQLSLELDTLKDTMHQANNKQENENNKLSENENEYEEQLDEETTTA